MRKGLIIAIIIVVLLLVVGVVIALSLGKSASGGTGGSTGGGTLPPIDGSTGGSTGGGSNGGIVPPAQSEVYLLGGDSAATQFDFAGAGNACRSLNARLATEQEVTDAQRAGAGWCSAGWTGDQKSVWPLQSSQYSPGCGSNPIMYGAYGVAPASNRYGAVCYGPKPARGTGSPVAANVPWGPSGWSRYG